MNMSPPRSFNHAEDMTETIALPKAEGNQKLRYEWYYKTFMEISCGSFTGAPPHAQIL